uniref:IBB domain-containing protein n=1 Tax=Amphimedon queenslandica TaxID=400682 RepID=A0A1X7TZR6_AMPQE
MASTSSSDGSMGRIKSYKNKGLDAEELRRRRETEEIQLRKSKRDEEFSKRRNISTMSESPFGVSGEQRFFEDTPLEIIARSVYSDNIDEQYQAISHIRKLISVEEDPPISDVIRIGVVPKLIQNLDHSLPPAIQAQCCWTLSNFCRGKTPPPNDAIVFKCLPFLPQLIYCEEAEILSDVCWSISFLCEGNNERIQRIINCGVVKRLVELLMHPTVGVITPSLRAIGNILTGDDVQTQFVINCSALPALQLLLDHPVSSIRKEACWAISNMTAGNKVQIQAVIDCNIFPKLLQIMEFSEYKIRKEAAWAVLNTTAGGTPYQIRYLANIGTIPKLCDLLSIQDPKILLVTLEGLDNILKIGQETGNQFATQMEESNAVERIEILQNHPQPKISHISSKIYDRYFSMSPDSTCP